MADFPHQRIRVARQRRQWDEMAHQIGIERGMMCGDRPLAVLADGRAVGYAEMGPYFDALPLNHHERGYVDTFLEPDNRCATFEQSLLSLYALPSLVIPYP